MPCLSPIGLSGLGALGPHCPRPCSPNSRLFSHLSVWAPSLPILRVGLHRLFGLHAPFGPSLTSGSHRFVPQSPICRGHLFVLQFPVLLRPPVLGLPCSWGSPLLTTYRLCSFFTLLLLCCLWQPPSSLSSSDPFSPTCISGSWGLTSCPACIPVSSLPPSLPPGTFPDGPSFCCEEASWL